MYLHYFVFRYLPLEKGKAFHFNKLEFPLLEAALIVPSLVEIGPSSSGEDELWKVYRQTDGPKDGQTKDSQQAIRKAYTWAFSSGEINT